jgi:hypothetical protein
VSRSGDFNEYPVVRVFSYKDGLLSRFAHDLQLALTDFEVEFEDGRVVGAFRTDAVVVEGVIKDGKLDTKMLSASDCKKILKNIREDVLYSKRYPEARLEAAVSSDADGIRLDGTLTLVGRRVACPAIRPVHLGNAWIAEVVITPSRWGIRPYKAMGGALKVQDKVKIEVALPASEDIEDEPSHRWEMRAGRSKSE